MKPTPWQEARTPSEVGELTALWLEGKLHDHPFPGHETEVPEDETSSLVPVLASLNRNGFLTDCSQPGYMTDFWSQRAFVEGFAAHDTAGAIRRATMRTRLVILQYSPGQPDQTDDQWLRIPVSLDGEDENTWLGGSMSPEVVRLNYADDYHADYVEWIVQEAWQVAIFDPQWGDNEFLWSTLLNIVPNVKKPLN